MGHVISINESDNYYLVSKDEGLERNKKQKEYLDYINNHILLVQKAYAMFFLPLLEKEHISDLLSDEEFKAAIRKAAINVSIHDSNKFDDEININGETITNCFDSYREKYYPTANELSDPEFQKKVDEKVEAAWIAHYKTNAHHPKHWVNDDGTIQDMPLEYIIEMICDWLSFNIKENNPIGVIDWYNNEAQDEKDAMSSKTKQIVEELLFHILFKGQVAKM